MGVEKKFIEDAITRYKVSDFLERELDRAGFSRVNIQRTPMVTRIAVEVTNPGRVIGKKGKTINDLNDAIKSEFRIDNPQISVVETTKPELEPRLVAKKACRHIEMGKNIRAIMHFLIKDIMNAGALGAEIIASGKIAAKGGRSKSFRVIAGFIPKAGEPMRLVREAHVTAYPKSGAIGVLVRIVPPGTVFPDKAATQKVELPKIIAAAEEPVRARSAQDEVEASQAAVAEKRPEKKPFRRKR
jgi:small subunit ribosomal protein S3